MLTRTLSTLTSAMFYRKGVGTEQKSFIYISCGGLSLGRRLVFGGRLPKRDGVGGQNGEALRMQLGRVFAVHAEPPMAIDFRSAPNATEPFCASPSRSRCASFSAGDHSRGPSAAGQLCAA
jgi:hypothetical protein